MQSRLQVLYEDNHLIAINKPAGTLSQADRTGDEILADDVKAYIKEKYNKPGDVFLGIVHRLDRPVSGVMLFARTSKALERVNAAFQERKIQKIYWAIVSQRPPDEEGELRHYLTRMEGKNITKAYTRHQAGSQEAVLRYALLKSLGQHHLLEVRPQTGRQHQIRVQLSKIGCPIKGDLKYGALEAMPDKSILLHARSLILPHPTLQKMITISAATPRNQSWDLFR